MTDEQCFQQLKPAGAGSSLSLYEDDLAALAFRERLRSLSPRAGVDFSSNDYLGLASSSRLRDAIADALFRGVAIGSGGSRLLRGNDPEHEKLELEAAQSFGFESSLFFSSGYQANLALFASLPQRDDLIVYDSLVHASARDGFRLSRAESHEVPHNASDAFESAILAWRQAGGKGRPWIAVESLYSMDGDRAPLPDLLEVAVRNGGFLVVDEAHATGVFGQTGKGLAENLKGQREHIITLHTCGKALGCEGALLCMPSVLREFVINRARPFIFATAPSPLMAAAVREALKCLDDEVWRREELWTRIRCAQRLCDAFGLPTSNSQIIPVILGDDARTMRMARAIQVAGFDVRGIRPPTVPAGTSRLRISLNLNASLQNIEALLDLMQKLL